MPSKTAALRCAGHAALCTLWLTLLFVLCPRLAWAEAPSPDAGVVELCGPAAACSVPDQLPTDASEPVDFTDTSTVSLLFFWGVGCPHCEAAKPFVAALARELPLLRTEAIEVRQDAEGRRRYLALMKELGAGAVGIPTFVVGRAYVVGYVGETTEREVRALVERARDPQSGANTPEKSRAIELPLIGALDPLALPLPTLTLAMGLVDGVNPCAMWVLLVLLGILLHVKAQSRMFMYAGTFVVMSGVVYFLFMTAWTALFGLIGFSPIATKLLGGALLFMGLLNLKELVWFKQGPSLVIPDRAKPGLYRRMRAIAQSASVPAALGGIAVLAFVVNLIELGCTIGLPAVYARVLSLRALSPGTRYAYLALYNVAYVVPLLVIALTFIALQRRVTMSERAAKVLKGVSGLLLVTFGVLFLLAPEALLGS